MDTSNTEKIKIHTEHTPNPNALKFILDRTLIENGSLNFPDKEKSKGSPLASRLFEIESVKEVFVGKDFITISKDPDLTWDNIYEKLIQAINKHFDSGEPIILKSEVTKEEKKSMSNVEQRIHELLDNQIRPAVATDGGDIIFESYKDGVLRLHLQGSCSSCPSSIVTLKAGVERMLKSEIPELKEVISV